MIPNHPSLTAVLSSALLLGLSSLAPPTANGAEAGVFPLVKFSGQTGRVGSEEPRSDIRYRASFEASDLPALALGNPDARVTIEALLEDEDGRELVRLGGEDPATTALSPGRGGKAWRQVFRRGGRDRNGLKVDVEQRAGDLRITIRFSRAGIDVPLACTRGDERTLLRTALTVDDGTPEGRIELTATQPWRCKGKRDGTWELRGQNSQDHAGHHGHPSGDENKRPQVKFALENETRENGVPNLIEIDASRSEDRDGQIVSYAFRVLERYRGELVFAAGPQAEPITQVWLAPGEYLVRVTATDDDASQHTETRRTSVRD